MEDYPEILDLSTLHERPKEEIRRVCAIRLHDLEGTLAGHPELFGYAEACLAVAQVQELKSKRLVERAKVEWSQARARYFVRNPTAPVTRLQEEVEADPDVMAAAKKYADSQDAMDLLSAQVGNLEALTRTLKERGTMLNQLAARANRNN